MSAQAGTPMPAQEETGRHGKGRGVTHAEARRRDEGRRAAKEG